MKNEKGITLVELLAVLAITGVITILIASVLSNGTNASNRIGTKQQLQQEANLIVEKIRAQYLLNEKEAAISDTFLIKVVGDELVLIDGTGTPIQLSVGFKYDLDPTAGSLSPTKKLVILDRTKSSVFNLLVQAENAEANDPKFIVNTSFSKLN